MWQAMESKATQVAEHLAAVQETRQQWAALTEPTRRMAVAADLRTAPTAPGYGPGTVEVGGTGWGHVDRARFSTTG